MNRKAIKYMCRFHVMGKFNLILTTFERYNLYNLITTLINIAINKYPLFHIIIPLINIAINKYPLFHL